MSTIGYVISLLVLLWIGNGVQRWLDGLMDVLHDIRHELAQINERAQPRDPLL